MADIEVQTPSLLEEVKKLSNSLNALPTPLTRSDSRSAANLLNDMLEILEGVQNPEEAVNQVVSQVVILSAFAVFKSMTQGDRHGYEIVIEPWLKIMHFLLSKTLTQTWMPREFTIQLLVLFTRYISPNQGVEQQTTKYSDEIKFSAVQCVSATFPAKYKEGRYDTFEENNLYYEFAEAMRNAAFVPIASPCVLGLSDMIRDEHNINLRLEALRVLSQVLMDNIYEVDLLADLLPGVASRLCATIAQKAEKENHQIMCSSLDVLGELISKVMSDQFNDTLVEFNSFQDIVDHYKQNQQATSSTEDKQPSQQHQHRDKAWYHKTKDSLKNVMGPIFKNRYYSDWRTRLAFVEFANTLLSNCARTMDNCVQPLVEIMILHTDDAYGEVSNKCQVLMQLLSTKPAWKTDIVPTLQEELYYWMKKFPQYMISRDETEKTNAMSLITGYILTLGDQASSTLFNVLPRIADNWMTALEIDKDSLNILEEKQSEKIIELEKDGTRTPTPIYPKIRLKYAVTDHTTAKLSRLLNVIGKYVDLKTWIYHFMRYISADNAESNNPQAAYVIHSLLSGAFALDVDGPATDLKDWVDTLYDTDDHSNLKLKSIILQVLKETMDILDSATSTSKKFSALTTKRSESIFSLDEESGHILTVCFGLQIVGLTASILDQEALQDELITMLYPLLTHLGSANVLIRTYALITLDAVAIVCGLENAQELAIANIDYIINSISQHISLLSHYARLPQMLKALIHVCGYKCIGFLDDSVLEIYDALDRYASNEWLCIQLCGVLFEVIQTLAKNAPKVTPQAPTTATKDDIEAASGEEVSMEIKSFIENKEDIYGYEAEEYKSMEEIGKYFLDRQAKGEHDDLTLQQVMEQGNLPMDLPKEDDENGDQGLPNGEEDKIPLNKEEIMAKEIMEKASHFLTASSPQLRSQMLILLTSGVTTLAKHPQELNQLIFGMWDIIVNRFKDPQNYVVLQAATLVERLSEVSTDYLSRKFDKDLWPLFKTLLRKGTTAAISNTLSDYSIYSFYHRTQMCLLNTLTRIALYVPISQPMIKEILEETKYYYHNDQVQEQLTDSCKKLFKALSTQQPDTVSLYEISMQQDKYTQIAASPLLDDIVIPEWMKPNYQAQSKPKTIMKL